MIQEFKLIHLNADEDMLHLGTETIEIVQKTVAIQTDIANLGNTKSIETHTEVVEMQDTEIQVSELNEMSAVCGKNDEKF